MGGTWRPADAAHASVRMWEDAAREAAHAAEHATAWADEVDRSATARGADDRHVADLRAASADARRAASAWASAAEHAASAARAAAAEAATSGGTAAAEADDGRRPPLDGGIEVALAAGTAAPAMADDAPPALVAAGNHAGRPAGVAGETAVEDRRGPPVNSDTHGLSCFCNSCLDEFDEEG